MKVNKYLVTSAGLNKLKEELKYREGTKKEQLKNTLEEMRRQGDLSENDGYSLALEDNKNNNSEIAKLKEMIKNAEIVEGEKKNSVEIGDSVVVKDSTGNSKTIHIVGENEANPLENKVSHNSPLGSALLKRKKGDKVTIQTPRGSQEYEILSLNE